MMNTKIWAMVTIGLLFIICMSFMNYVGCGGAADSGSSFPPAPAPSPTLNTTVATDIMDDSATLRGTVDPNGISTSAYFQYGQTMSYGKNTTYTSMGSGTEPVDITADITGLASNKLYNFRLRAIRSDGTFNGSNRTFTTLRPRPTCVTNPATSIGPDFATLNGTVNPNGLDTDIYFEYGISVTPITYTDISGTQAIGSGTSNVVVYVDLTGLTVNTTYNFRVYGTNATGTQYGSNRSFLTGNAPNSIPTCTTDGVSDISYFTATAYGTVNPNALSTTAYFNYGLTTSYAFTTTGQTIGSGNISVAVSATFTSLTANKLYNFRVAAVNSTGPNYGANMTFTTLGQPPSCTTITATNVGGTSATLNGLANPNGFDVTSCYFEYGTTGNYNITATANTFAANGGTISYTGGYTIHTFTSSGTFQVSVGTVNAEVYCWGAGGAGGTVGGWSFGAAAGAGGAARGTLNVVPGTYSVVVGGGGIVNGASGSVGGGGATTNNGTDNQYSGGGGGYSGVFLSSVVTQTNAIIIAGGGGGGGSSRQGTGNVGGAGGGTTGQAGSAPYDGRSTSAGNPGTQTAAGANAASQATSTTDGRQGPLQGGRPLDNSYGGAGGGGYWGGSAGGYYEANTMGGGGGGSGYISSTLISGGVLTAGSGTTPGDSANSLRGTAGNAGAIAGAGTAGVVIIRYIPPITVGSGTSDVSVSANINGLALSTTYNYRLVTTGICGTTLSNTTEFTTPNTFTLTFNPTSTGQNGTIQNWTVTATGIYRIEVWGAQGGYSDDGAGGNTRPGYGARMRGDFNLTAGNQLKILVGQAGSPTTEPGGGNRGGAGGGGTFVTYSNNTPLIIAAGGGGENWLSFNVNGVDGATTNNGTTNGGATTGRGAGGGGLIGNGNSTGSDVGGTSFTNGGAGGSGTLSVGGFGGGGGCQFEGGGGGGYNGGDVIGTNNYSGAPPAAAGSYNAGTNQDNTAGARTGAGLCVIIFSP
jgi:hypothetical protein